MIKPRNYQFLEIKLQKENSLQIIRIKQSNYLKDFSNYVFHDVSTISKFLPRLKGTM